MHRPDSLEARLSRLETETRGLRRRLDRARLHTRFALGAVAVMALVAAAAPAERADVIQARRFEVLNAAGELVAALGTATNGGQLDVWTTDGHNVLRASATDAGGDLNLWNAKGNTTFAAFTTTSGGGAWGLWSPTGTRHVFASSGDPTEPGGRLEIQATDGTTVARVAAGTDGGHLNLAGNDGRDRVAATAGAPGGALRLATAAGQPSVLLETSTGGGAVSVHDEAGRSRVDLDAGADPGVRVRAVNGSVVVEAAIDDGGSLRLRDGAGAERLRARASANGAGMQVFDGGGAPVVTAAADTTGAGRLETARPGGAAVFRVEAAGGDTGSALTLFDPDGIRRIGLGADAGGGQLAIVNATGQSVVAAGVASPGGAGFLDLSGTNGTPFLSAAVSDTGHGRLDLAQPDGGTILSLGSFPTGPVLAMYDPKGQKSFLVGAREDGALLNLFNGREVPIVVVGAGRGQLGGTVSVRNEQGLPVAEISAGPERAGRITVVDPEVNRTRVLEVVR